MAIKRPGDAADDRAREVFANLRESEQVTISVRVPEEVKRAIEREAERKGLKASQLVRTWIMDRIGARG